MKPKVNISSNYVKSQMISKTIQKIPNFSLTNFQNIAFSRAHMSNFNKTNDTNSHLLTLSLKFHPFMINKGLSIFGNKIHLSINSKKNN